MSTLASVFGYGLLSARAAASVAGRFYYATDTSLMYRDNGSTWDTLAVGAGSVATDTIWDAAGDLVQGTGANTAAKLSVGSAGYGLQVVSGSAAWVAPLTGSVANGGTSGDQTTTSNSWADVTGATGTLTTGARRVRCRFTGTIAGPGSGNSFGLDLLIDAGTREGNSFTFGLGEDNVSANNGLVVLEYTTAALSAGAHTIKLQWRSQGGGTTTLRQSSGHAMWQYTLEELPF